MQPLITLSASEALARWKLLRHFEPILPDAVVVRSDAVSLDDLLLHQFRSWHLSTLLSAPVHLLPQHDIAAQVSLARTPSGAAVAELPPDCLRICSVMLQGWDQPARIITDLDSPLALAQASPYARGGCARPIALAAHGSLLLFSPPPGQLVLSSLCIVRTPADDSFEFTPYMFSLINPPSLP